MNILSITFHIINSKIDEWKNYIDESLILMTDNLIDVEKYIISEVESEMINEGINTNLLLVFENESKRKEFMDNEFENIKERIEAKFSQDVMIFVTFLNPKKARF